MLTRLTYCPENAEASIVSVNGGFGAHENLQSLGLDLEDRVRILTTINGRGPLEVLHNSRVVSIGRELAAKLIVETDTQFQLTLDQIRAGDLVEVIKIESKGEIRFRLLDMGLVRGVKVQVVRYAPLGDPMEVFVEGFNLTLRRAEAASIQVRILKILETKKHQRIKDNHF